MLVESAGSPVSAAAWVAAKLVVKAVKSAVKVVKSAAKAVKSAKVVTSAKAAAEPER